MEDTILFDSITYFLLCDITSLFKEFLYCCLVIINLLFAAIKLIIRDESFVEEEEDEDETLPPEQCHICKSQELTYDDIKVVMSRLGMGGWRSDGVLDGGEVDKCKECGLMEGIHKLLEEKEASLEELEEAFYVFDRNEDGFISPKELWSVLRRLGLEGMSLGDCERMIAVFDEDGDGRINFREFKSLLEGAR
ncbi:probable calcium-binding protein CML46 [Elaeis guineensis]|uniref:Calmodulin-like protein 2 n=1 Tax=Elaeis guineensis var. tenera TaxID=51953 RepID=A0A6I9RB28_ELAGV|nr:calmodulin-like protein 2 [Elaeis guineensis]